MLDLRNVAFLSLCPPEEHQNVASSATAKHSK